MVMLPLIERFTDAMFGCWHDRITWPVTIDDKTRVCCLECGKEFEYDFAKMKVVRRVN